MNNQILFVQRTDQLLPKLTVVSTVSVAAAVMSVLNFYRALSTHLSGHQPLAKLLAFKLIVGLSFLERVSFPAQLPTAQSNLGNLTSI